MNFFNKRIINKIQKCGGKNGRIKMELERKIIRIGVHKIYIREILLKN